MEELDQPSEGVNRSDRKLLTHDRHRVILHTGGCNWVQLST
jgi:hypothetical protein